MINKSKLALITVLAAMSVASPAFSKGYGTGNVTPYSFEPSGTAAPQNGQTAARRSNASKVSVHQDGHGRFAGTGAQHRVQYTASAGLKQRRKRGRAFPRPRFPCPLSRRPLGTSRCDVFSGHLTKVRRRAPIRAAIALHLRQLRKTCRQKIDECPGFRRQKVAVRIDGIDRRCRRLVLGQQAD
jgi:hypothetical protein